MAHHRNMGGVEGQSQAPVLSLSKDRESEGAPQCFTGMVTLEGPKSSSHFLARKWVRAMVEGAIGTLLKHIDAEWSHDYRSPRYDSLKLAGPGE